MKFNNHMFRMKKLEFQRFLNSFKGGIIMRDSQQGKLLYYTVAENFL